MGKVRPDVGFYEKFGVALRRERVAHGWTQETLAGFAGLSPNFVARAERGELGVSLYTATLMAGALGVKVDYLLRIARLY